MFRWIDEGGKDNSQFWLQTFCDGFQRTGATGATVTDSTIPSYDFQIITFFALATSIREGNSNFIKIIDYVRPQILLKYCYRILTNILSGVSLSNSKKLSPKSNIEGL